jgi:hypothetical protein
MSGFEYLIALASVVAGLGLTRALSGFAKIIHMRGQVRVSDINVIWTLTILLWLVSYWWFTFSLTAIAQWDIPLFLFVLVYGALIFFLIALLFPDNLEPGIDLFEHFLVTRRWFFGAFIGLGFVDLADVWIKLSYGIPPPDTTGYSIFMAAWLSVGIIGAFVTRRAVQRLLAYLWFVVVTSNAILAISPAMPI